MLSAQRDSNPGNKITAQKLLSTQDVLGGLKLFVLSLVLARWPEVQVNGCGSGCCVSDRLKETALSQSRILFNISLAVVASARG